MRITAGLRLAPSLLRRRLGQDRKAAWQKADERRSGRCARERTLSIGEARRVYAASLRLPYPAGHFVRLPFLTGARRAEISGLRWDGLHDEADGMEIVLPSERTKMGSGHHIALSAEAVAVIEDARRRRIVGSHYVLSSSGWTGFGNYGRTKAWLDKILAEDGGPPISSWTWHDSRRTIVSILAAKPFRYDPVTLDKLLGHQPSTLSAVARIYQREENRDLLREALETWATHLAQAPAEVVDIKRVRKR